VGYENDHERDALAAALYAYDAHVDQFERISEKTPPRIDREAVIAGVVAGEKSVETVVAELRDDGDAEDEDGNDDAPRRRDDPPTPRPRRPVGVVHRPTRVEG
jgi:hypothetical protein